MILDANDYRTQIPYIVGLTQNKDEDERYEFISILAIASSVPVIAVVYYLIELYGSSEKLLKLAQIVKDFYGITEVKNIKE